jgi:surface polysaccharide O-acyltransferase-like enzyme
MPADPASAFDVGGSLTTDSKKSDRYHALDRVRAVAMLLGVVYHTLLFRMFTGGGPPPWASMGQFSASKTLGDWLHSFRMPLFFLIAGFFARMMLAKYGTRTFLAKRYVRIGFPLLIGMFTFGPIYVLTRDLTSTMPSLGPDGSPPVGVMRLSPGGAPAMTAPPRGLRVDEEREVARDAPNAAAGMASFPPAKLPLGPPGMPPGGPGFRAPAGGGPPFGPPGGGIADMLFGRFTRFVQLNHLWFLWYLLVFVTVAPFLTKGLSWLTPPPQGGDRIGVRLIRWGLAPLLLGIASTPALLMTSSPFGWFLGLAPAIFRAFPDFLLHLDPDMAFYLAYFLFGWWLHRDRAALPSLAQTWLPNLLIGLGAFWAAMNLEQQYGGFNRLPNRGGVRLVAYAIYCVGSASTSFAFLGVFLRHFDQPSRTWRYLADTALWVYLIHQPLVLLGLAARPLNLPWWALTALVSASTIVASLLLYELVVRPTPLIDLFGPSSPRRATLRRDVGEVAELAVSSTEAG